MCLAMSQDDTSLSHVHVSECIAPCVYEKEEDLKVGEESEVEHCKKQNGDDKAIDRQRGHVPQLDPIPVPVQVDHCRDPHGSRDPHGALRL